MAIREEYWALPFSEWTEEECADWEEHTGDPAYTVQPIVKWTTEQRKKWWKEQTGSPDPVPIKELLKLEGNAFEWGLDYCDDEGWLIMCGCGHRERQEGYYDDLTIREGIDCWDRPFHCQQCQQKFDNGEAVRMWFAEWWIDDEERWEGADAKGR